MPEMLERIKKFAEENAQTNPVASAWLRQIAANILDIDEFEITVFVYHDGYVLNHKAWTEIVQAFPEWFESKEEQ